jgi:hypothetical protein
MDKPIKNKKLRLSAAHYPTQIYELLIFIRLAFLGFGFGFGFALTFRFLFVCVVFVGTIGLSGWRAVIGGIETLALKDNAHRLINLTQRRFSAFRADN